MTLQLLISIAAVFSVFHFETAQAADTEKVLSPDTSIIDEKTSPCDDFFQYACGGWLAKSEIPADRPFWDRSFSAINKQNQLLSRELLEGYAKKAKTSASLPPNPYAKKLGDYYTACMDESKLESSSLKTLKIELNKIDKLKKEALPEWLATYQLKGVALFFRFGQTQDYKNPREMIAEFHQGGMTLPTKDYYLDDKPEMAKFRQAYLDHMKTMFTLSGIDEKQAEGDAKSVLELETKLAKAALRPAELRDPSATYHRMDLKELTTLAPSFAWDRFIKTLKLSARVPLNVTVPDFMKTSAQVLQETDLSVVRAYIRIRLLDEVATALPDRFVNAYFDFVAKNFLGLAELPPRWKRCVDATQEALGYALSRSYVAVRFSGDSKPVASKILTSVENQMGRVLDNTDWMDPGTRKEGKEKLTKLVNHFGYPKKWRSYDGLKVSRDSYLANLLNASEFDVRYGLNKIGKTVDRDEWEILPSAVNAYYDPQLDKMVFTAGILQPPFFDQTYSSESNYAGIGMVMGHEISHGFDDQGRQFDSDGSLRDWWSEKTAKEFGSRAQCLAKQFDTFKTSTGDAINGQLTLGENIGDQGGLKIAHGAWKNQLSEAERTNTEALREREKTFFLSFAQSWCGKQTDAYLRTMVRSNPHPPGRFRVLGALMNNPDFAAAYQCQSGTKMAPKDRCVVW